MVSSNKLSIENLFHSSSTVSPLLLSWRQSRAMPLASCFLQLFSRKIKVTPASRWRRYVVSVFMMSKIPSSRPKAVANAHAAVTII